MLLNLKPTVKILNQGIPQHPLVIPDSTLIFEGLKQVSYKIGDRYESRYCLQNITEECIKCNYRDSAEWLASYKAIGPDDALDWQLESSYMYYNKKRNIMVIFHLEDCYNIDTVLWEFTAHPDTYIMQTIRKQENLIILWHALEGTPNTYFTFHNINAQQYTDKDMQETSLKLLAGVDDKMKCYKYLNVYGSMCFKSRR